MNLPIDVYEPANPFLYKVLSYIKRALLLPRSFHPTHIRLNGRAHDGTSNLTLNYIGEGESVAYLRDLVFSKIMERKTHPCSLRNISKFIADTSSDHLLFVELNSLLKGFVPAGGQDTFPWIRQKVHLKKDLYGSRKAKIRGKYGRKAIKHHYCYRIVHDAPATKKFYEQLYRPYIYFRFGDATHPRRFKEIRRVVNNGFLLQVFDENVWVAGAACRIRKDEVTLFALGLLSDFDYHLRRGALSSIYYFLFRWAEENNIDTIDLLRSRPSVADGVYEHKRFWGAQAEKDIWPHTFLRVFIPRQADVPPMVKGLLVWREDQFIELEKAVHQ